MLQVPDLAEASDQGSRTVLAGFDEWVAATPDNTAVVSHDGALTYRELDQRANRLAWALRERGAGRETVVGICLRRGVNLAVAVLAVIKAGAAYLPLEPEHPDSRLRAALTDGGVVALLADQEIGERLELTVPVLGMDPGEYAEYPADAPVTGVDGDNLLYVLFTSGSTGRPKAIAMHHRPQVVLLDWCRANYAEQPVALQYFPATADVASLELLSAWWSGGRVVVAGEWDRYDTTAVAALIREHRVTRVLLPVVAMQQLAEHAVGNPQDVSSLRELITTGDKLVITPAIRQMCDALPGVCFDDHFGSTEVNVVTAPRLTAPATRWPDTPLVGKPMAEARIYVLDGNLEPVPKNVVGEIFIGGTPPARGYLGSGALTAAGFVPDPFSPDPGRRMYRTGDLGRWRTGGELEFLGRGDFQVKVRGYRIEPGEIESVLTERDDVAKAVVAAVQLDGADAQESTLVAYVVAADGTEPHPEQLRDHLVTRLPAHMIPQAFVLLDSMPLTATGKVDRKRLPQPEDVEPPFVAPRDDVESRIAEVWAETLGIEKVGVHHNFFWLGGHSMLVTRVVYQLRETLGVALPPSAVFRLPTVESLAREARELMTEQS